MKSWKRKWAAIAGLAFLGSGLAFSLLRPNRAHDSEITGLEFLTDSLVTSGHSGGLKVWNVESKELLTETRLKKSTVDKFCLLKSSRRVVVGGSGSEGGLRLGDLSGPLSLIENQERWKSSCVLAAHEGTNRIVVGYADRHPVLVRILDMASGESKEIQRAGIETPAPTAMAFSSDGGSLVIGFDSGRIEVIDIHTLKRREVLSFKFPVSAILQIPSQSHEFLISLVQKKSGYYIQNSATGSVHESRDNTLWKVNVQRGNCAPIGTFTGPIDSIAQSPEGNYLSWSSVAGSVILYDLVSGQQSLVIPPGDSPPVTCIDFSMNGKWLATGNRKGHVILWNLPGLTPTELK